MLLYSKGRGGKVGDEAESGIKVAEVIVSGVI